LKKKATGADIPKISNRKQSVKTVICSSPGGEVQKIKRRIIPDNLKGLSRNIEQT